MTANAAKKTEKTEKTDAKTDPIEMAARREQRNKHDAKAMQARCNELLTAIGERGYRVDLQKLQLSAMLWTLGRILVTHGVTSEDELESERLGALADGLAHALQEAEERRLAENRPKVEPVRAPGLVVARR